MFGLFKRRIAPPDPVTFRQQIVIDRPPEAVFALLDFDSADYRQAALGHRLERHGAGEYRLTATFAPQEPFLIEVIENRSPELLETRTKMARTMGHLDVLEETYRLAPSGANGTRVVHTATATFDAGLSWRRYGKELCFVSIACVNELRKLKLHAEQGAEAARAVMLETDTAVLDAALAAPAAAT